MKVPRWLERAARAVGTVVHLALSEMSCYPLPRGTSSGFDPSPDRLFAPVNRRRLERAVGAWTRELAGPPEGGDPSEGDVSSSPEES